MNGQAQVFIFEPKEYRAEKVKKVLGVTGKIINGLLIAITAGTIILMIGLYMLWKPAIQLLSWIIGG